jgi:hypothetical protein
MNTSEQAGSMPDSQSIEAQVGAWLSGPERTMKKAASQAPQPQAPLPPTDQAPETDAATSESGTSEPEAEPTASPFEEVEYEGETYQVPPKLKEAIIRQSDYTKKTQEVADQRRTMEVLQQESHITRLAEQFKTDTAQEHQQLQALEWALQQQIDWNSLSTEDALRAKLKLDGWRDQKTALEKSIGEKRQDWERKQHETYQKIVNDSLAVVAKKVPGWSPTLAKKVTEHALSEGYTDHELRRANTDPRLAVTLWKAQQYDEARKSAQPAVAQAKAAKISASNPMPANVKSQLNFRKTVARTEGKPQERKAAVESRVMEIFGKR